MRHYIRLLRPYLWYKNFLVFLPLFFASGIFNPEWLFLTILGFVSLCLISSTNYITNDIIDRKTDRLNPEKKDRPICSGAVSVNWALFFAFLTFLGAVLIASYLDIRFLYSVLAIFGLTQAYSLWLKNEAMVDAITISVNFVLRAMSGAYIIDIKISQWLIIGVFFLALFLTIGKRASESNMLREHSSKHRKSLSFYTKDMTYGMLNISTALLLVSYLLFSVFSIHKNLYYSIPIVLYPMARFYYLIESGSEIPRHLERMWKDKRLVLGIIFSVLALFLIVYWDMIISI